MSTGQTTRRLAAILAADVVGYSRLMGQDETGTLAALKALRTEVIDPKVAEHSGRVFKSTGDGLLAEFPSVVNAVNCAVVIQQAIRDNTSNSAIQFRIGINVGDVIVEEGDVFGEGVNVASRIEGLASPGGIALTENARDHLGSRLNLDFTDTGTHSLKNIERPIRVFVIGGGDKSARTADAKVTDKPSIAVLPFVNMSGDPEQQYFSDGITEDIITELSRFRPLRVIARNASFRFRGDSVDVLRAGRELGAQYLLEGSVRKIGNKVRITAQLIDAATGSHVWANRFDNTQENLFEVQDQVVRTLVSTLAGRVRSVDMERAVLKPPANLAAYDCVLRASALPFTDRSCVAEVRRLSERAIELAPNYGRAHALLSYSYLMEWFRDFSTSEELLDKAYQMANRALVLDENDSNIYGLLGWINMLRRSFDKAELSYRRALELNPNQPDLLTGLGQLFGYMGKPEDGVALYQQAKELDPYFEPSWYWLEVGILHFMARRYEQAITTIERSSDVVEAGHAYIAASYAHLGRMNEAYPHAAKAVRLSPELTITRFTARDPYKNKADLNHLVEAMRKAGLPE
jgi:adenylate cyclase